MTTQDQTGPFQDVDDIVSYLIQPIPHHGVGQYNFFTCELEHLPQEPALVPEEAWLCDPDFGLVLPALPGNREQGTRYRDRL